MSVLIYLIPVSLALGAIGLVAFLWSFKSGQYQDLDGAGSVHLLANDLLDAAQHGIAQGQPVVDAGG